MGNLTLHKSVYHILRAVFRPLCRLKYEFRGEVCRTHGPALVMSNHTTTWDQFFLGVSFPEFMYFVASEHLFRLGLASVFIKALANPIARKKGADSHKTVKRILYELNRGVNVCIMVEGNCSFNGETGWISDSAGKLAKASGAALVLYRFEGGYMAEPRWADKLRRGPVRGRFVRELPASELKKMKSKDISDLIRRELYVDAFEVQRENPKRYRGKNLAQHLERSLCVCPICHGLDTMRSQGDYFICGCGFKVKYNEYGFFEPGTPGGALPFETVLGWDRWQREYLKSRVPFWRSDGGVITSCSEQTLKKLDPTQENYGEGTLSMYSDRLEFNGEKTVSFPLSHLAGFAVARQTILLFSTDDGNYYESRAPRVYCANLYNMLWRYLTGRRYI